MKNRVYNANSNGTLQKRIYMYIVRTLQPNLHGNPRARFRQVRRTKSRRLNI